MYKQYVVEQQRRRDLAEAELSIRTKKKIRFVDLVRPEARYSCYPTGIQETLELYRWMICTSKPYVRYMYGGPLELLSADPGIINIGYAHPLTKDWAQQLWWRMQHVLLHKSAQVLGRGWVEKYGISLDASRVVPMRYYYWEPDGGGDAFVQTLLNDLLGMKGTFVVSPNNCWPEATELRYVALHAYDSDKVPWVVKAHYGIPQDSSGWTVDLAMEPGEMLLDYFVRALRWLQAQLVTERGE